MGFQQVNQEDREKAVNEILETKEMASGEFKLEIRRGLVSEARAKLWTFVTGCSLYLMNDPAHFEDSLARCAFVATESGLHEAFDFGSPRCPTDIARDHELSNQLEDAFLLVLRALAVEEERFSVSTGTPERYLPCLPDICAALVKVIGAPKAFTVSSLLILQSATHGRFFPTTRAERAADLASQTL